MGAKRRVLKPRLGRVRVLIARNEGTRGYGYDRLPGRGIPRTNQYLFWLGPLFMNVQVTQKVRRTY